MNVRESRWITRMSVRCDELHGCLWGAVSYIDVCELQWITWMSDVQWVAWMFVKCDGCHGNLWGVVNYMDVCMVQWITWMSVSCVELHGCLWGGRWITWMSLRCDKLHGYFKVRWTMDVWVMMDVVEVWSVTNYIDAIGAMKYIDVLKYDELWMSVSCDELHGCLWVAMNYTDVCEVRWITWMSVRCGELLGCL